jgi:MFS family permease
VIRLSIAIFLSITGFHAYVASLPVAMHDAGLPDPEIGVVMGASAVVQIVAAFAAGSLIDRYGGRLVFLVGAGAFALASLAFLFEVASATAPLPVLLGVRLLQGIGMATAVPSGMSLVPAIVDPARLGVALSIAGSASNVALAAGPPVSLALLDAGSMRLVGAVALVSVLMGGAVMWGWARPGPRATRHASPGRAFHIAYRRSWTMPLLITMLFIIHWGVVTAYLPQRAEAAGADVGLFYVIDAVSVLVLRIPMGYLTDRLGPRPLLIGGCALTGSGVLLLLLPPETFILALSGLGTGVGAAFAIPAITVELAHRSDDRDRGSAFSLYGAAFAGGIALGSIGAAPFIGVLGFEGAAAVGAALCLAALLASLFLVPPGTTPATEPGTAQTADGALPAA